jgi:copper transport protein
MIHPRLKAILLVVLLACGLTLAVAGSSSAHAQLESTSPQQGAKLDATPQQVSITFSENITPASGGIRVLNAQQKRFDVGGADANGPVMSTNVTSLPDGAYVVVWQAVSADGHPISGSYTFQVGQVDEGSGQQILNGIGESTLAASSVNRLVQSLLRLSRFVLFAAAGLLVGASVWRLAGLPNGVGRWINVARIVALVSGVANLFLDGPYVEGRSLSAVTDFSLATGSLGRITVRALVGAAVVAAFLASALNRSTHVPADSSHSADSAGAAAASDVLSVPQRVELVVAAVLVSVLLAAGGHGAAGDLVVVAVLVVAVHILAASTWVGGLVLLAGGLAAKQITQPVLRRWSTLAQISVGSLLVSGMFNTWRQVGSVDALKSTHYGRLLMSKLLLILAMIGLGAWHRRRINQDVERSIRRSVLFEVVLGVAVLSVSSWLSSTVPAKAALVRPISLRVATTSTNTEITISPAKQGKNVIHLYAFDKNGRTTPIVDAAFVLTHVGTGTILDVSTIAAGRGHQQALAVDFPYAGLWRVETKIYVTDFDVENAESTVMIR